MFARDRHGTASLTGEEPPHERTATVVAVAVDCSPAALRAAVAGHVGEVVRRTEGTDTPVAAEAAGGTSSGALLATFDSVGAALDAAVLAQQRSGAERAPRIALAHGGVVERRHALGGPAADAALTLLDAAQRGEVLADDVVRALAAERPFVRRTLRGDSAGVSSAGGAERAGDGPAAAWALILDDPEGMPLPPVLRPGRARWPFVGRAGELAAIRSELATLDRGERRAFLLAGEPGIGKTRLAAEAAAAARASGAVVLYGRSDEGVGSPYQPFAQALGDYVAHAPDRVALPVAGARELATLVPALRGDEPEEDVDRGQAGERYVLFAAVASLLTAASAPTPVLLVVDDLHWADEPTVLLLRHLMNAPGPLRLLVLAAYRPTGVPRDGVLATALAELGRDERVTTLPLEGLADGQIAELVEEAAGGELDARERSFADALHRDTGGNPLFAGELLRGLGDVRTHVAATAAPGTGSGERDLGGADALPAPASVRDLIASQVARLGEETRSVLGAAAVLGPEFDLALVGAVAGDATALDAAIDAELIVPADSGPGRFTFRHTLIRTTLYEGQGAVTRGLLHRRAAEAMESAGGSAAALARHWSEAQPPGRERALHWAERAGRDALDHLDPHAAVRWYRRALELNDGEDAALLIGLGTAQRQRGEPAFRETLLEAARLARRQGDTDLLVAAALANTRGFVSASGEVDEERVALLRAALEALGEGDSRERALLLATLASELSFAPGFEQRLALSDEAVAVARRLGDRATLCRVLSARFVPIWVPETLDERLDGAVESVRIADELGDPLTQFQAIHWHGVGLLQAARMDDSVRAVQREKTLAARLGEPTARWLAAYDDANLAIVAGRLDQAEELAQEALAVGMESGQPDAFPFHANQLTNIRYEQGRLAELQPLIAEIVAQNPGIPGFRALLALACVEGDLLDEAAALLAEEDFAALPHDVTWLAAHVIWAHVCAGVGVAARAQELYERLAPFGSQVAFTGVSAWGDADHALARLATVLGRHEDAERRFAASTERYARMGAPVWLARVALDEASMRLERGAAGDGEHAAELLETAHEEGRRLGAAQIERRAGALREHERASAVLGLPRRRTRRWQRDDADAAGGAGAAALVRAGELWTLRTAAGEWHLRDSKGLGYLVRLLGEPHEEVHVLDLQGESAPVTTVAGEEELALASDDAGALLDPAAKRAYRLRLEDLEETIAEAERFNDPERAAVAQAERAAIAQELASAVGLGGRDRKAASVAERARVNATRAVRKAIERIGECDAELGAHLERAVRTGTFCAYDPAPQEEVRWELAP